MTTLIRFVFAVFLLLISQVGWAEPNVTLVRVIKHEHKLQLFSGNELVREFNIVFGANPKGHKIQEGDERTPEGSYILDYKKADSAFYRAIHISYPNTQDIAAAKAIGVRPEGQIMIHGQKNGWGWLAFISKHFNWTNGCIALTNRDMDVVWALVKEGTPIELLP